MSQPVKLSDALVLDARIAGEVEERSIAGQVEFWAKLGRSLDLLLEGRQVLALRRNAGTEPLSEALASVNTSAGRKRLADTLASQPYPHFKPHPHKAGLLVRTDEDGKQTVGRFVNRVFSVVKVADGSPSQSAKAAKLRTKNSLKTRKASTGTQATSRPNAKERRACV
jgi:ParD-like antitoxin of type II bacterial toxin-antitoxin system